MQRFRSQLAALACLVVGVASFALSYVALSEVAVRLAAVPAGMGWLVPIVIDGGVICGSAIIWSLSTESVRRPVFPFLFVGFLVLVSVVVNIAHAGPSPLAKCIAALPPLILLGTLELVASHGRRLAEARTAAAQEAEQVRLAEEERVRLREEELRAEEEERSRLVAEQEARERAAAQRAAQRAAAKERTTPAPARKPARSTSRPQAQPAEESPAALPSQRSAPPAPSASRAEQPAPLEPSTPTRSRSGARQPRVRAEAPVEV